MIPQIQPWIDDEDLDEVIKVIKSTYVTENQATELFENIIKEYTGSRNAIAITNGTMALYVALVAMGIGSGDEVIVPNLTFVASSNAVLMTGATPVLCEVRRDTFCLDINQAHKLINQKTKVIMPVHLYGQSADMDAINAFAKTYKLYVLEDAAQGVGVFFNKKHTGTMGDIGVLSFYGNKTITTGEGGVVLTQNDDFAKKVYRLKNHGRDVKGIFEHKHIGYNFAFTEMQAALGISQMGKLERVIKRKKQINDFYRDALINVPQMKSMEIDSRCSPVYWFTSYMVEKVEDFQNFLFDNGIQTRRFFYPLDLQPCYQNNNLVSGINQNFSVSHNIYNHGVSLPSSYNLSYKQLKKITKVIYSYFENRN